jgi:transcriptional regulator with XRE-family HTH domain
MSHVESGYGARAGWLNRYQCEWSVIVGDRVRRLRRKKGMTLGGLANAVSTPGGEGYSSGYLSKLERGFANPPLYTYLAIAVALGVEPGRLLGSDDALGEVSDAELTLIRALRVAAIEPYEALARLVERA